LLLTPSAAAGALAKLTVMPLDTIKKRMQVCSSPASCIASLLQSI
jgi:hypothetical protein